MIRSYRPRKDLQLCSFEADFKQDFRIQAVSHPPHPRAYEKSAGMFDSK